MGTKTTTKVINPEWVNKASESALGKARDVASVGYTPYTGDRIAGLSENERAGNQLASDSVGQYQSGLNEASSLYGQAERSTGDVDLSGYRNPYMQGALDVGDRELTKDQDIQRTEIDSQFASAGGMGNSRRGNIQNEVARDQNRATAGMTKGMNEAATQGALGTVLDERQRKLQGGDSAMSRTVGRSANVSRDIAQLYGTGENGRKVEQAFKDFDYTTYREGRDWDVRNLNNIMKTIGKVPHDRTVKSKTKTTGGMLGGILGLVGTAVGAYFGGAAGATIGGKIGGAAGGALGG